MSHTWLPFTLKKSTGCGCNILWYAWVPIVSYIRWCSSINVRTCAARHNIHLPYYISGCRFDRNSPGLWVVPSRTEDVRWNSTPILLVLCLADTSSACLPDQGLEKPPDCPLSAMSIYNNICLVSICIQHIMIEIKIVNLRKTWQPKRIKTGWTANIFKCQQIFNNSNNHS